MVTLKGQSERKYNTTLQTYILNKKRSHKTMNTIVLVISLIIVSVVVIIIPPCGAALGRRMAK